MEFTNVEAPMRRSDAIGAAAVAVTTAAQQLSRTVHGTTSAAIPIPTAYGLLFHIKLLLNYTASITEFLPTGLHFSLGEPGFSPHEISERAERNLTAQIDCAARELQALTETLRIAITHTEAVQALVHTEALKSHAGSMVEQ